MHHYQYEDEVASNKWCSDKNVEMRAQIAVEYDESGTGSTWGESWVACSAYQIYHKVKNEVTTEYSDMEVPSSFIDKMTDQIIEKAQQYIW